MHNFHHTELRWPRTFPTHFTPTNTCHEELDVIVKALICYSWHTILLCVREYREDIQVALATWPESDPMARDVCEMRACFSILKRGLNEYYLVRSKSAMDSNDERMLERIESSILVVDNIIRAMSMCIAHSGKQNKDIEQCVECTYDLLNELRDRWFD